MRLLIGLLLLSAAAYAQQGADPSSSSPMAAPPAARTTPREIDRQITIPAGTHVPVSLRNAISTKSSHVGDQVYAQTTFPVVINDHIVIPAGTYVQGKISSIKPAGRIKGSAEVLMHFTSLIYPNGYTVMLPGSIESAPGVDKAEVKDKEGTIKADSNAGKVAKTVGEPAATGAVVGGLSRGLEGGLIGAGVGGAIGTAIAAFGHGNEIKLGPGTTLEVILQRNVAVDSSRIRSRAFERERAEY
jgi:type IV secretion system protein VirB10